MVEEIPIFSSVQLIYIFGGILLVFFVGIVCFTIIFKKDPNLIELFKGGRTLHMLTVIAVVIATIILGLERILSGSSLAGILGGIVGYVLGSLKRD